MIDRNRNSFGNLFAFLNWVLRMIITDELRLKELCEWGVNATIPASRFASKVRRTALKQLRLEVLCHFFQSAVARNSSSRMLCSRCRG